MPPRRPLPTIAPCAARQLPLPGVSAKDLSIRTLLAAAEFATLAVAAALALRVLAMPVVRREAAAHRVAALAIAVAIVAVAAALSWAVVSSPVVRHVASATALALMLAAGWHARIDRGAGLRWPPGSLGLRASLAAIDDRRYYLDQAARHGPVFKTSQFGRPVACVVGLDRAHRILVDRADALAPAMLPYNRLLTQGVLRYMSGATHKEEAPVFRAAFARMDLAGAETALRTSLRRELAALAAESTRTADGAYARPAFERWLYAAVIRIFYGLDPDDVRVGAIVRHLGDLGVFRSGGARWRRRMIDGLSGIAAILRDVEREGRSDRSRVAGDSALRAMVAIDPEALDRPSRLENFALITRLAASDLTGLADWTFRMLDDPPRWIDAVRAHGRSAGAARASPPVDPATAIVMETLRLEQSEYLYRRLAKPIEVDGCTIPAGWLLRICVQESHRDAAVFADPDRYDPSRFVDRAWTRREYSPFGGHTHGCMGAHLAFFLGRLFVEELALGYDWTVVRDGPPERGTRHRDHWRPSPQRRVVLRPWRSAPVEAPEDARVDAAG